MLALLAAGCAHNSYRAAKLPERFAAPPVENMQEIDLSGLSNPTVGSEMIDRGDILEVTIVTELDDLRSTTTPVRVAEDGSADVPLVGRVGVAGLELEGAEHAIAAAARMRGVFNDPHITVAMRRRAMNRVTVIGAVEEPGVYNVPRGSSSLLTALVEAGGLREDAGAEVEIRRAERPPSPTPPPAGRVAACSHARQPAVHHQAVTSAATEPKIVRVNLARAASETHGGRRLDDGDVVIVRPRAPKPVYVIGLVNKPGEFDMPHGQELRVLDAIAMAGDRKLQIADRVTVRRRSEGHAEPVVIEVNFRQAKYSDTENVRLAPGDIVTVEETPATMAVETLSRVIRVAIGGSTTLF